MIDFLNEYKNLFFVFSILLALFDFLLRLRRQHQNKQGNAIEQSSNLRDAGALTINKLVAQQHQFRILQQLGLAGIQEEDLSAIAESKILQLFPRKTIQRALIYMRFERGSIKISIASLLISVILSFIYLSNCILIGLILKESNAFHDFPYSITADEIIYSVLLTISGLFLLTITRDALFAYFVFRKLPTKG